MTPNSSTLAWKIPWDKKASLQRLHTEAVHLHTTLEMTKVQTWFHVL